MMSVGRDEARPARAGQGHGADAPAPGWLWRPFFDNLVDCIRQPRRNEERKRDEIRRVKKPLREAGVRMVDRDAFFWQVSRTRGGGAAFP